MGPLDDWHDSLRVLSFLACVYSFLMLIIRSKKRSYIWNVKTKDYWFALLTWTLGGCILTIQGIVLDLPFTPGVVLVTAASLVTGKAVHSRGGWGDTDE